MADEINGRVMDAVLGERLTQLSHQMAAMNGKMDIVVESVQRSATDIARHDERLKTLEEDQAALESELQLAGKRSNLIDAAVSLGTAFGIFLGLNRP